MKKRIFILLFSLVGLCILWNLYSLKKEEQDTERFAASPVSVETKESNDTPDEETAKTGQPVEKMQDTEAVQETEAVQDLETDGEALPYYHYEHLEAEEQTVYDEVYTAITGRTETVVSTASEEVLDKIYNCVLNDHPEIFYTQSYTCTRHMRNDKLVKLFFEANYVYDLEECNERMAAIETAAGEMLSGTQGQDDFSTIKYLYDSLVNTTEYQLDSVDNQNICSVFLNHRSVCQGYAKAMQYLLNKAGIETAFVTGTVEQGTHAWNLVKADQSWYYLDPTWGDVDYQSASGMEDGIDKEVLPVNYDYFLITSDKLLETHTPNKLVALPNCIATEDNYYIHQGLFLTGLDTQILKEIFDNAYEMNTGCVTFQCANEAVFGMVRSYLIDEQHIFDYIKANNKISYYDNEDADTMCFWL